MPALGLAPVGAWVHLAFVSDTTTRLYVNGVLQDTIAATIPLPLGQIGYDSSGYAEYVKGILDEVFASLSHAVNCGADEWYWATCS